MHRWTAEYVSDFSLQYVQTLYSGTSPEQTLQELKNSLLYRGSHKWEFIIICITIYLVLQKQCVVERFLYRECKRFQYN